MVLKQSERSFFWKGNIYIFFFYLLTVFFLYDLVRLSGTSVFEEKHLLLLQNVSHHKVCC